MEKSEELLNSYKIPLDKGLTSEEVNFRNENNLTNKRKIVKTKSHFKIIFGSFFTLFNVILYCVAIVIALFQIFHPEGLYYLPVTKYGFFFVIICNALTSIISQEISKHTVEKMKLISSPKARVIRNGKEEEIEVADIVKDDILILKSGNEIPCDLVILEGSTYVNEAMLTGESSLIHKTKGDVLLSGSYISNGTVKAYAYKVGNDTYISSVEQKIYQIKKKKSYLITNINKIIKILLCVVFPLVIAVAIKQYYVGTTIIDPINGQNWVFTVDIVNKCAATVVGMIPIGMILLTTITLAESIVKLYKEKTMVQELYAIENLSRVDTLCLDKTGTLTTQNYIVKEVISFNKNIDLENIIANIVYSLNDDNSTSIALKNSFKVKETFKIISKVPFTSEKKVSAITTNVDTYSLGAPEYLLKNEEHLQKVKEYASLGYRVIAISSSKEDLGIVILKDELSKGIKETLQFFNDLNVEIKIISGDNVLTVKEISKEAGVKNYDSYISMENVSIEEIAEICDKYTIFGRATPDQKQEIIRCLEEKSKIVGYIGDGVNDTQSLRQANCSIALKSGADSTKAVSDVILLDDDFSHLPYVLKEGRRVVSNVQRSLLLFLTKSIFIGVFSFISLFTDKGLLIELETIYIYEFVSIAFCGVLLSLQNNKVEPIKGSFVKNVLFRALFYGGLMTFSASLPLIVNSFITLPNLVALITISVTCGGLIILLDICMPLSKYTFLVFSIGTICSLLLLLSFPSVFLDPEYLKGAEGVSGQIERIFDNFFDLSIFYKFINAEIIYIVVFIISLLLLYIVLKVLKKYFHTKRDLNSSNKI